MILARQPLPRFLITSRYDFIVLFTVLNDLLLTELTPLQSWFGALPFVFGTFTQWLTLAVKASWALHGHCPLFSRALQPFFSLLWLCQLIFFFFCYFEWFNKHILALKASWKLDSHCLIFSWPICIFLWKVLNLSFIICYWCSIIHWPLHRQPKDHLVHPSHHNREMAFRLDPFCPPY